MGSVSRDRAGVGSGINNTFRQLGIAVGIAGPGAIFTSAERSAFVSDLVARDPRLAARAHALAGSLTSGGAGSHGAAGGKAGQAIALATRAAFVSGLDRILWVAVIGAAVGAILSAVLLRTRYISSEPEFAASDEEQAARQAAGARN